MTQTSAAAITAENKTLFKVSHLNKTMGKRKILDDISFEAYAGEVFGFLGPNGAGKTTTIKIAVGLLGIDSGSVEIGGADISREYEKALSEVGAIVENPEMYKYLTGRQNLEQCARVRGGITKERIGEAVELVGLSNRIDEKISKYSLGMRQRLGVAQAILHRPKTLILDEPTNGLDPAGIKELRDILKNLAHEEGICVIVSSHLMSEMELMCDRVGIIANGRMIGVHTLEEMISASSGGTVSVSFRTNDPQRALELTAVGDARAEISDGLLNVTLPIATCDEATAAIVKDLVGGGIRIYSVSHAEHKKLEDVFIQLTQNGEGGGQIG